MRRAPYINLMKGLIAAWCPSVGVAGGSTVTDRTKYHRDLQLSTYEAGSAFGASGTGVALNFTPGAGGAYTYNISQLPSYGTYQQFTVSAWHNTRSYDDGLGYYWNNAIFEIVTDYTFNGQRFILQNSYDPVGNVSYIFTDGVFAENNLTIPGQLPLNKWVHFCMVIDNWTYRFYIDGKLNQYGTFGIDYVLDYPLFINVGYRDGYDNFDGYIDDLRFYNRMLNEAEIYELASRRGIGLEAKRWRRSLRLPDLSDLWDFADTKKRNQLSVKEEEQIAAQLLKARAPKQPSTEDRKKALEWKRLVFEKINGATTEQELEAVNTVPTESVEVTAAVLAEVERQKEAKRLELEIVRREAELKAAEFDAQLKANEEALYAKLEEQRQALIAAKQLQLETLARHQLAIDAALEQERQALLLAEEADKQAAEFNRKREQRLKRIKALMLLAKLDL